MNICSHKHEEICYEGRICPFCTKIDEMQAEIDSLNEIKIELYDKIDELKNELN